MPPDAVSAIFCPGRWVSTGCATFTGFPWPGYGKVRGERVEYLFPFTASLLGSDGSSGCSPGPFTQQPQLLLCSPSPKAVVLPSFQKLLPSPSDLIPGGGVMAPCCCWSLGVSFSCIGSLNIPTPISLFINPSVKTQSGGHLLLAGP